MILASHGYTVTTPARLDKAVRHWQKVNGLLVDGIVTSGGPTLASLRASLPPPAASAPRRKAAPTGQKAAPAPAPEPVDVPLSATPGDAESIIRAVWPDDVEDWAVAIARRESNLQPGAGNSCCKGLFAIHWYAHQAWLSDYGANSPSDLYDPTINARVALALFQQAGVAPWLCHGLCKDIPL